VHRFFVPRSGISSHQAVITDTSQAHHLKDVLRLRPGAQVEVFDEEGRVYACRVSSVSKTITLEIADIREPVLDAQRSGVRLTVGCALLKPRAMDELLDKLTQAGVERFIPLAARHSISRVDKARETEKVERWKRIALAAVKQSKGAHIPEIYPPQSMRQAIQISGKCDLKLIAAVCKGKFTPVSLRAACGGLQPGSAAIFIGPEGDFTVDEVKLAVEGGFVPVSLGDSVLRAETAAVAAAAFIKLYFQDEKR